MSRTLIASVRLLWVVLALLPATAGADTSPHDPQAELRELRERIARLESLVARQAEASANSAVINKAVAEVEADAQQRSALAGGIAGYDRGFFIASTDGRFVLRPSAVVQIRAVSNARDGAEGVDTQSGFELRRTRFQFDGNVFTPDLTYRFIWDAQRQGGTAATLDAWVAWRFHPDWSVRIGQFVESWFRERDVAFLNQLAVDRSLVETVLGSNLTDRVQGVAVTWGGVPGHDVRVELTLHDGALSRNTDFRDEIVTNGVATANPANFGIGGRFEYKCFGDWDAYRDFTARGNLNDLLVLGAGFDVTQRGDAIALLATCDAQYETRSGWNAWAVVVINAIDDGSSPAKLDYGVSLQGGYLVTANWEVFARCGVVILENPSGTGDRTFPEYTAGVNYYISPAGNGALHRAKLTFDFGYLPNGSPADLTGIGVLGGSSAQLVLRGQLQLRI
jgi:hypothetical protein